MRLWVGINRGFQLIEQRKHPFELQSRPFVRFQVQVQVKQLQCQNQMI
jgi:hypothetical protein